MRLVLVGFGGLTKSGPLIILTGIASRAAENSGW